MDYYDQLATRTDACREYARNIGMDHPDRPWVLTDWDTWERNPFYHGVPVPHPEDCGGGADVEELHGVEPVAVATPVAADGIPF